MHDVMREISKDFELSEEQENTLVIEMAELFDMYDLDYSQDALHDIVKKWAAEKGRVINTLAKHPNWNTEKFQIQFMTDYKREINLKQLTSFFSWVKNEYASKAQQVIKRYPWSYRETKCIIHNIESIIASVGVFHKYATYKGKSIEEYQSDLRKFQNYFDKYFNDVSIYTGDDFKDRILYKEDHDILDNIQILQDILHNYFETNSEEENIHLCPKELVTRINGIFPDLAREGQKISKILTKLCKNLGLTDIVDIKDNSFYDENGVFIERKKDFGWNYQQAQMGDAINPLFIKRFTIISVNPIDYLTMSFGHKWHSCHDWTKGQRYSGGYRGEYCAGTISYMLDPSSIIFYTVDENYNGTELELQDKMQRSVMAFDHDKFYEGRVYPDGRDGGDQGYAPQFRAIMQKTLSECLDVNNLWVVKKGSRESCEVMTDLGGQAYNDWSCCADSFISYLKINDELNIEKIQVNAPSICVSCGRENTNSSSLLCNYCNPSYTCDRCGGGISEDEVIWVGDYSYCCHECVEEDGFHYCSDISDYRYYTDCCYDDYDEEYFADTSEMVVVDGYTFRNADNANDYGYIYCDNIEEWKHENNVLRDDYTGEYFYPNYESITTSDGNHYVNEETAESDGYAENENGEWVPEDELENEEEVAS